MADNGFSAHHVDPVAQTFYGFRGFMLDETNTKAGKASLPDDFHGGLGRTTRVTGVGLLRSVYLTDYRWGPGTNTAVCDRAEGRHGDKPVEECMCGFWAYTRGSHNLTIPGYSAFGIVEGWGRVVIGPFGFRAEKAAIRALCFPGVDGWSPDEGHQPQVKAMTLAEGIEDACWTIKTAGARVTHSLDAWLARALKTEPPPPFKPPPRPEPVAHRARIAPPDLVDAVASTYKVPVFDTIAAMQAEFPVSDITALLPKEGNDG